MTTLFNIARMTTGSTGTGSPITLGSAVTSFLTFAQAGVTNGMTVRYVIEDGASREVGSGVYTSSGTTLTRSVVLSTNSNNAINLSGSAQVALTALAEDIVNKTGDTMTGALNWATTVSLASASTVNIGAAASNVINITGVTTINAFDTIAAGAERVLVFAGALTLVHSASLICIGSANITTAAGDIARFASEGSGVWRMIDYERSVRAEVIESTVLSGSAVSLSAGTSTNVTSISLTAGDWDVWGSVWFNPAATTNITIYAGSMSTTSATFDVSPAGGAEYVFSFSAGFVPGRTIGASVGKRRYSLTSTTTVYLLANSTFTVSTNSAYGYIGARRVQ